MLGASLSRSLGLLTVCARSGECAGHFRKLLAKYPPQVQSRSSAAAWACHIHNQVNKSLKKRLFDCSKIGDFYDCGCADDEKEQAGKKDSVASGQGRREQVKPLKLEKEG